MEMKNPLRGFGDVPILKKVNETVYSVVAGEEKTEVKRCFWTREYDWHDVKSTYMTES